MWEQGNFKKIAVAGLLASQHAEETRLCEERLLWKWNVCQVYSGV